MSNQHIFLRFSRILASDFPPVLPDFPQLSAHFRVFLKVTLNSYSRGADPLLFISVDPNSMPCLGDSIGTHGYVVGVGNPAIHLSFGDG